MSSAGLLNGIILNGTIRYTFAGCVAISAQAQAIGHEPTRIVLPEGQARSEATILPATATRTAFVAADPAVGAAVAPAVDAWKITGVSAQSMDPAAVSTAIAVRNPLVGSAGEAVAQSSAEAVRFAYATNEPRPHDRTVNGLVMGGSWWSQDGTPGTAGASITFDVLATTIVSATSPVLAGEAVLSSLAYDLTRWMTPRPIISRALTFNHDGDTATLTVNQQYSRGTGIARAHSRGLHSAILAKSLTYADSESSLSSSAVYVARDAVGERITGEALGSGQDSQSHSVASIARARAEAYCSPSFYFGGSTYKTSFAWGAATAMASASWPAAVRKPQMTGVVQPAWAQMTGVPLAELDAFGRSEGSATARARDDRAGITHLVRMKSGAFGATAEASQPVANRSRLAFGEAYAKAELSITPWLWNAVAAQSVAESVAGMTADGATRYAKALSNSEATAIEASQAFKVANAAGVAFADGATASEAVAGLARVVESESEALAEIAGIYPVKTTKGNPDQAIASAEAAARYDNAAVGAHPLEAGASAVATLPWATHKDRAGARRLRRVYSSPEPATAYAGLGRNVFKINADEPAPERRRLYVSASSRAMAVPHASREYRI